jgi:hypothetical protein
MALAIRGLSHCSSPLALRSSWQSHLCASCGVRSLSPSSLLTCLPSGETSEVAGTPAVARSMIGTCLPSVQPDACCALRLVCSLLVKSIKSGAEFPIQLFTVLPLVCAAMKRTSAM